MTKLIAREDIRPKRSGSPPIYPWTEWTDGQWREAVQGEDYKSATKSFQSALYHHARNHGFRVVTHLTDNGIAFCFSPDETGEGA